MVSYLDYGDQNPSAVNRGVLTTDYNLDQSDVARMRAGVDLTGTPYAAGSAQTMGQDAFADNANTQSAVNTANWAAADGGGGSGYRPSPNVAPARAATAPGVPTPVVTSQPPSYANSALPPIVPGLTPGIPATTLPTNSVGWNPTSAAQAADAAKNTQIQASTPLDYSSPAALAASQRVRASTVPGANTLLANLMPDPAQPYQITTSGVSGTPAALASNLVDPATGKPLPGNQLDIKMVTDPRFQKMQQLDQINGTNNAANFYQAMTGRSLDSDRAANQALMATQNANKLAEAKTLSDKLDVATSDNPELGIKKGDYVTRNIVASTMPGQLNVTFLPLTAQERELAGLAPDINPQTGSVNLDQYGRPSYKPTGNSLIKQAIGLPAITDLDWGTQYAKDRARVLGLNNGQPPPQRTSPANSGPSVLDKALAFGSNTLNTVSSFVQHPIATVLQGGGDSNGYVSAADIARLRANSPISSGISDQLRTLPSIGDVMSQIKGPFSDN